MIFGGITKMSNIYSFKFLSYNVKTLSTLGVWVSFYLMSTVFGFKNNHTYQLLSFVIKTILQMYKYHFSFTVNKVIDYFIKDL